MCFNKETSLTAYFVGITSSIFLLYRGYKNKDKEDIIAFILLFFVSQMQLIEYFLWKNQVCNRNNLGLSILIIILLYMQPVAFYFAKIYFYNKNISVDNKNKYLALIFLYTILLIYIIYRLINLGNIKELCTLKDKNSCRLNWSVMNLAFKNIEFFIMGLLFLFFYVYLFFSPTYDFNYSENMPVFTKLFMRVSALVAIIYTIYIGKINTIGIFGSLFCFFCAFWGIFKILKI